MATISIWTTRVQEDILRSIGYKIPQFPEQGEVLFNGNKVGYIDNFSGLCLPEDHRPIIANAVPSAGIWDNL